MRVNGARMAAILAIAAFGLVACSGSPSTDAAGTEAAGTDAAGVPSVTLRVAAAASLQRPFDEIANAFEAVNPGFDVAPINYDGSSTLAIQIVEGAPFDVFASADERNMENVIAAGLATGPTVFATNTLVIAVPAGNPAGVSGLTDLAAVVTVLCAPEVPCGGASQQLLENAGVEVTPASFEQNVTAVLAKVSAGEADAGLVYLTDVAGDDSVDSIVPQGADAVVNRYPIATVGFGADAGADADAEAGDSTRRVAAQAFVDFVLGEAGQSVLAARGFGSPD